MDNKTRIGTAVRFVICSMCVVSGLSLLAVGTLHAAHTHITGVILSATGTVDPEPPAPVPWLHALGWLVSVLLLFLSAFSLFVLWGLLYRIATFDTDERSLRGAQRGVWKGVLPSVDELPMEGD